MADAPILGSDQTLKLDDEVFGAPFRAGGGGGAGPVWGPPPRHYTVKVNRKARRAALRSALSVHAERSSVFAFDPADFDGPSTKRAAELLADRRGGSLLGVVGAGESRAPQTLPNLPRG